MPDVAERLDQLRREAEDAIRQAGDAAAVEQLRVRYLGRKSELTGVLRSIGDLDASERGPVGKQANAVRQALDERLSARADELGTQITGPVFEGERYAHGGLRTDFAHGAIFHKRGLGTHWLKGATRRAYKRVGGVYGALGYPKTDALRTGVSGVFLVRFEGGSIYRVGKKRGYLVRGRIMLRYRKRGGVEGRLGAPTVTLTRHGPRDKVTFEHGRIVHNRESGKINVIYS